MIKKAFQKLTSVPLPNVNVISSRCVHLVRKRKRDNSHTVINPNLSKIEVISCKRKEFNHHKGQTYKKFEVLPLASEGWYHKKSVGDYFKFNPVLEAPSFSEDSKEISFESLGIDKNVVDTLREQGITQPTSIQVNGIKEVLSGNHTLLAAETGSGKTLTYLLPLLQQVSLHKSSITREGLNSPLALILTPRRELAEQIGDVAKLYCDVLGLNSTVITGGHTKRMMVNPVFEDVDIVISTLGAYKKLTTNGIQRTLYMKHIILDEADTLLDDSFNDMLRHFLQRFQFYPVPGKEDKTVQLILASATHPTSIVELLGDIISTDTLTKVKTKYLHRVQLHVPQTFLRLGRSQKAANLLKLVNKDAQKKNSVLIFSNKSPTCDWISLFLNENGVPCTNLSGDMPVDVRIGRFQDFQSGKFYVMSCTDLGSRGLDTINVKHVINYDFPIYMADYVHRCGRVGRVGSVDGCHVTNFVAGDREIDIVQKIEQAVRLDEPLHNVNPNITKIIKYKVFNSETE